MEPEHDLLDIDMKTVSLLERLALIVEIAKKGPDWRLEDQIKVNPDDVLSDLEAQFTDNIMPRWRWLQQSPSDVFLDELCRLLEHVRVKSRADQGQSA